MKFIRKNGRIIPIRDAGSAKSAHQLGKPSAQSLKNAAPEQMAKEQFSKMRKAIIFAAGSTALAVGAGLVVGKTMLSAAKAANVVEILAKYKNVLKTGAINIEKTAQYGPGAADLVKRTLFIHPQATKSVVLHEMGHLAASQHKGFNAAYKAIGESVQGGQLTVGKAFKAAAFKVAQPFANLGAEAEASGHAIRAAWKVEGKKEGLKTAKDLVAPYATYVGGAGAAGGTYKAAYHASLGTHYTSNTKKTPQNQNLKKAVRRGWVGTVLAGPVIGASMGSLSYHSGLNKKKKA